MPSAGIIPNTQKEMYNCCGERIFIWDYVHAQIIVVCIKGLALAVSALHNRMTYSNQRGFMARRRVQYLWTTSVPLSNAEAPLGNRPQKCLSPIVSQKCLSAIVCRGVFRQSSTEVSLANQSVRRLSAVSFFASAYRQSVC